MCFTLFHVFQFSCHIPVLPFSTFYSVFWHILGPRLWISHFPRFSVFITIFQVLQCVFLILPPFSVFLAIYQVLPCAFLIFLICHFSCHIQDPTVCVSHFSHFQSFSPYSRSYLGSFSFSFRFPGLSPYSRSYSMHFSFSTCFSFTCHITCPIMCVFHFLRFSVFFFPYSRSYSVCF